MTGAPAPAIQFRNVSRWYGNVVAVNDVTFDVGPGITGLLGPNGAGKSTILHIMAGLLRPSAGEVHVLSQPAWRNPNIYRHIGLVPEREAVYSFLTGRQFVELAAHLHRLPDPTHAAARAIDLVDMAPAASRPTGDYSKGMKQRIKIAAALVHDPQILILDEPFNGADPRQRLQLMDLFRTMAQEGRTILYSSHILEEVERLADTVLVIVAGRLAASGDFRQIRALMTDRPHTFTVRSSNDRALAARLLAEPSIRGVAFEDGGLEVRADELLAAARALPAAARQAGVTLHEVRPTDESLESVFSYLVRR